MKLVQSVSSLHAFEPDSHLTSIPSSPSQIYCVRFAKRSDGSLAAKMAQLDATRQNSFKSSSPHLKILITDPKRVLLLAKVTLQKALVA